MFTEGLDENAIKWIKQGTDLELLEQPPPQQIRSPLAERLTSDPFPNSPLLFSSNGGGHALPPLKFHSGLLAPHSLVAPSCLSSDMDVDDDNESVDSVSDDYSGANFSDEESKPQTEQWYQEEEEIIGYTNKPSTGLNRGFLKEGLRVEVPGNFRRFTESEVGFKQRCPPKTYTPCASNQLLKRVHLHTVNGTTPSGDGCGMVRDFSDLGTPSAPPIFEVPCDEKGFEVENELRESNGNENWTCPSMEAVGHGESVEGLADVGTSSMKASELDERVNIAGETETNIPSMQASQLDHSSYYSTRFI